LQNPETTSKEIDFMKIGIIGTGFVGVNLGKALAAKGHQIVYGVRDLNSPKVLSALVETGSNAKAGNVQEAANAEMVALAVPWAGVEDVVSEVGNWQGKLVIDATNRFATPSDSAGSAGQDLARMAAGARVVKAFNTIGAEHYLNPVIGGETASMFICGDDTDAKSKVAELIEELGFAVVDCGPLSAAALTENLAKLWVHLARTSTGRNIAFKLLRG
jgi:predicted dinucleotide-binding enzyme